MILQSESLPLIFHPVEMTKTRMAYKNDTLILSRKNEYSKKLKINKLAS